MFVIKERKRVYKLIGCHAIASLKKDLMDLKLLEGDFLVFRGNQCIATSAEGMRTDFQ